jgi:hypothetical protein
MNVRMKIAALIVFTFVALSSLGPLAERVNAFQGSGTGRATIYQINGTLYNTLKPQLYDGGTVVYRMAGSTGAQTVRNYYEIWRYNGVKWVKFYTTPAKSKTIPAGANSVRMPQLNVLPSQYANYYYVVQKIEWISPIGGLAGHYTAYMNQVGDYKCANVPPHKCSVGNGYIYLEPGP